MQEDRKLLAGQRVVCTEGTVIVAVGYAVMRAPEDGVVICVVFKVGEGIIKAAHIGRAVEAVEHRDEHTAGHDRAGAEGGARRALEHAVGNDVVYCVVRPEACGNVGEAFGGTGIAERAAISPYGDQRAALICNGGRSDWSDWCDYISFFIRLCPVAQSVARARDRGQGAVGLILAVYRDAVAVGKGAAVGVEYRVYEMGVVRVVVAVEEDLRLVYAASDKSGEYLVAC